MNDIEFTSNAEETDDMQARYLTFLLGSECYGVDISRIIEIIQMQPITEIPDVPDYVKGIINLRGQIIPVMDCRLRFQKPFVPYTYLTCIIVCRINAITMGLIVDSVSDVLTIPDADISPPPEISENSMHFLKGISKVGEDVKLLLDLGKLVD